MHAPPRSAAVLSLLLAAGLIGCAPTQTWYLGDTGDLSYYLDQATQVSYPDLATAGLEETYQTQRPITVLNPDLLEFEDLTLEDVISIALQNSLTIRGYGTPGLQGNQIAPGVDSLTVNPAGAGTVYNVAIAESEPGFLPALGQQGPPGAIQSNTALETNEGVEAALSEFDAQYRFGFNYDKQDRPRNSISGAIGGFNTNPFSPTVFQQDAISFNNELSKKSAAGTQLFFRSITDYSRDNVPIAPAGFQALSSVWTQSFEMEVRQPLLRGRGALVNRMPVIIARIRSDQELAILETQLQNMLCNIEIRYWNLHCAYRAFESAKVGLNSAKGLWSKQDARFELSDTDIGSESQTREQFYFFRSVVEQTYSDLLDAETDLRWLMGWASTDGRLIRPVDEPTEARIEIDWEEALQESLVRRPELRQERWEVKKKELQLAYARNSLLPEVNATALYRWLGLGDFLWGTQRNRVSFPAAGSRAMEELTGGDYQELRLGLEFNTSIGFRRELANVRNAQVKLARELTRLEDVELDTARELSMVYRAIDTNYRLAQSHLNRWAALRDEVDAKRKRYDEGEDTIDELLDAQRRRADAQISYFRSLCEYNKAIALLHRRKGTTLDYCGVQFAEGPWPSKAYMDAEGHARRRSNSHEINYGWTRPWVISQDTLGSNEPIDMHGQYLPGEVMIGEPTPADAFDQLPGPEQFIPPPPVDDRMPLNDGGGFIPQAFGDPDPATGTETVASPGMIRLATGEEETSDRPLHQASPIGTGVSPIGTGVLPNPPARTPFFESRNRAPAPGVSTTPDHSVSVDSLFQRMGLPPTGGRDRDSRAVIRRSDSSGQ